MDVDSSLLGSPSSPYLLKSLLFVFVAKAEGIDETDAGVAALQQHSSSFGIARIHACSIVYSRAGAVMLQPPETNLLLAWIFTAVDSWKESRVWVSFCFGIGT